MITPFEHGEQLAENIRLSRPSEGQVHLWRLGQAGILFRFPAATVLVDPYLSNHCEAVLPEPFDHRRMTRAPLDPVDLDAIDIVVCTHDHLDHLDPPTIRTLGRQNPGAVIVVPVHARAAVEALGWDPYRVLTFDDGTTRVVATLHIEAFAVPHEGFDEDETGHPYLGFAFSDGHLRVAHVGDALSHPRILRALRNGHLDALALPINGRDEERASLGFAGNMNAEEAVALAGEAGAALTVPMHYDMFAQNVDDDAVGRFSKRATTAGLRFAVAAVGERVVVEGGTVAR